LCVALFLWIQGLFASQRFDMFDVVGEYIGCVLRKGADGGEREDMRR
jgi:hypothetical protein